MRATCNFSAEDHARVSDAVHAAEATSDGEIAVITAGQSDSYADWAMTLAALAAAAVPLWAALWPEWLTRVVDLLTGGWRSELTPREMLTAVALFTLLKLGSVRLILGWMPLRMALVPPGMKRRRVRRSAVRAYRIAVEARTRAATGALIYLSLAERRAEIVADDAITSKVGPDPWGDAMAALIQHVRDGRATDGLVAAVGMIGATIAAHFPRSRDDKNELPDRLIEL